MDFPLFHLDFFGNRLLIAVIAIVHVIINHALAVGFIPLVTLLEYRGFVARRYRLAHWIKWDHLSRRLMGFGFIVTTSLGALTGVGIWIASSLTNPASIGTLVRVFYMAWFIEWIVFCLEVIFIMLYFLSWKRSTTSLRAKLNHVRMGFALSLFSWITMAIITAILGFMMDPGDWLNDPSFWHGFLNPIYFPQLMFRTGLAMIMGGCVILFLAAHFLRKHDPIRGKAIRFISFWILFWTPYMLLSSYLYYFNIPSFMIGNLPVALGTQAFQDWYDMLLKIILGGSIVSVLIGVLGVMRPKFIRRPTVIIPILVSIIFLGSFERIREFVRKPYVIGEYMYANGLLKSDYPYYQEYGVLQEACYRGKFYQPVTAIDRGEEVFRVCCTRCHTTRGVNSIVGNFEKMYGKNEQWDEDAMQAYISGMHNVRYYMPPFPGNKEELSDLTAYLVQLRIMKMPLKGVQSEGISFPESAKDHAQNSFE